MPDLTHPAAEPIDTLRAACEVRRGRGSGPGGQHRNKVETAVTLTHRPTGVRGQASERRRQGENLAAAMFRLRVNLALEVRCPAAADASPSGCWRSRTRGGRLAINPGHDDFPTLLAEALDRLAAVAWDPAAAARSLEVTASQLLKLLRHEPAALELLNRRRAEAGLGPLR